MRLKCKYLTLIPIILMFVLFISCREKTPTPTISEPCVNHTDDNNDNVCDDCGETINVQPTVTPVVPVITVSATSTNISLKDEEVNDYDFKQLFTITKDDANIPVIDEFLDLTNVSTSPGTFIVTCTYENETATVTVEVKKTVYSVVLYIDEITINTSLVSTYDYLSLFVVTKDGKTIPVTDDMITNNVKAVAGTYTYIVNNNGVEGVLTVNVTNEHNIEVIETYNNVKIHIDELPSYDFTRLFALYADGSSVQVTSEMLDLSKLENAEAGNKYMITLNYQKGETSKTYDLEIEVIQAREISVVGKNMVIYPNSEYVDLCSLFEIKVGEESVPVTSDMITGTIDYTNAGINEITLDYLGHTATATIEVKTGVVINHRYSDVISIAKGTNQSTYDFANDFKVVINGIEIKGIPYTYLDISDVDFNTAGTYQVTITIPYNDKAFGLSGVNFTNYEETISYVVVDNNYEINVLDQLVELPKGTTEYDVYKNLKVIINGRNQTLTEIPEYASVIACYVKTISDPIDFTLPGNQEVIIEVYANGPDNDPVVVTFDVIMETELIVEAIDKVIYTGDTLYTKDLFIITKDGEPTEVSNEYIDGYVDMFTPGVYEVKISYMGIEKSSRVVVLDRQILGTYKTMLTSLSSTEIDAGDEEVVTPGKMLADLIINEDGSVRVLGKTSYITSAIDEKTLLLKIGSYDYTLYYEEGIVVLDPDNSIKLSYTDDKRPMIYFKTDMYTVLERFIINSLSNYVLDETNVGYSIDAFKLQSNKDYTQKWYGLKVHLTARNNPDTVYSVSWGEVVFADGFVNDINQESSMTMNGETYGFKVSTKGNSKVIKVDHTKAYANTQFSGTFEGKNAILYVDSYGGYTFRTDDQTLCAVGTYDVSQMKNGGLDFDNSIVMLYSFKEDVYSYKLQLDVKNLTFECLEKDHVFGKYQYDDYMIFFDGYGKGILKDDIKSYYEYQFTYTVNEKEISIKYFNTSYTFLYGTKATFYMDDFGNTLTVGYFEGANLVGKRFENQKVEFGAIIRVKTQQLAADSDSNAKAELYRNIEIVTKDGVLTGDAVKNYVTTSFIRFNTPGFYEFTVKVDVYGQTIIAHYGLQVLDDTYSDHQILGTYHGVITDGGIVIDKHGFTTVNHANEIYTGFIRVAEDNSFVINAYNDLHASITVVGETIHAGLVRVRCSGAITFADYFTTGSTNIVGCEGVVLRTITVGNNKIYLLSSTATSLGNIVTVELLSGSDIYMRDSILKIVDGNKEQVVKVVSWDNVLTGLIKSDPYRGTYQLNDNPTIIVDGFGNVTVGETSGTYDLNGSVITVVSGNTTKVYRLNVEDYTYEVVNIVLDSSLMIGKLLNGSYTFYCGSYQYTASTSFEFKTGGVVVVRSSSSDHDGGEDGCIDDVYTPPFASGDGTNGTYAVRGNQLTINVNGYTFVFKIKNVMVADEIICISTNLNSDAHGYFKIDSVFN